MDNIKVREFKDKNYHSVYHNGKTLRQTIDSNKPILELVYPEFLDVKITNACNGGCKYCLDGDSLIKTTRGDIKIKDISHGENVYVYDIKSKKILIRGVEQLHKRKYNGELIIIYLENNILLKLTPNHKVFVIDKGFVRADQLNENDDIYTYV